MPHLSEVPLRPAPGFKYIFYGNTVQRKKIIAGNRTASKIFPITAVMGVKNCISNYKLHQKRLLNNSKKGH